MSSGHGVVHHRIGLPRIEKCTDVAIPPFQIQRSAEDVMFRLPLKGLELAVDIKERLVHCFFRFPAKVCKFRYIDSALPVWLIWWSELMRQPEALDGLAEVPPVVRDHPA